MNVMMSILQYLKCVSVKPESATDEWDKQLPEPNGYLSKFVTTNAIEWALKYETNWRYFLDKCPTMQGTINHLDSHDLTVDRVNFPFLIHKVSFQLLKDIPI